MKVVDGSGSSRNVQREVVVRVQDLTVGFGDKLVLDDLNPYGKSVFAHKPAAVISQSQGAMGGFGANHALRQSLVFLDMPTLQQPEVYLGGSANLSDEMRNLKDDHVSALLTSFLEAFANWVAKNSLRSV